MTKFLNLLLLMAGNLDLEPVGKRLKLRLWGMGEAFPTTCLLNRWDNVLCCPPIIQLHPLPLLALMLALPYQQI